MSRNTFLTITDVLLFMVLALCVFTVSASDKTFPIGVPFYGQAFVCNDVDSAKRVADNKAKDEKLLMELMLSGKCGQGSGIATYLEEVYKNGEWTVWKLVTQAGKVYYEATDWKPRGRLSV